MSREREKGGQGEEGRKERREEGGRARIKQQKISLASAELSRLLCDSINVD